MPMQESPSEEDDSESYTTLLVSLEDKKLNFTASINERITIEQFLKQLPNPRDRAILTERMESTQRTGTPTTYAQMGKKFQLSKARLQQCVKRLYQEYQEFILC